MEKKLRKYIVQNLVMVCCAIFCGACVSEDLQKDPDAKKELVTITLEASQEEDDANSRTYINNSTNVFWSNGDQISVFCSDNSNNCFSLTEGAASTTGKFTGTASGSVFCGLYPYTSGATFDSGTNTISGVTIPTEQTATEGSFDPTAAVMTAYSSNGTNMQFHHLCTFAKVTPSVDCSAIELYTDSGYIAGTFDVTINTSGDNAGIYSSVSATTGSNIITLKPATTKGKIEKDMTYYIALMPNAKLKGYECTLVTDSAYHTQLSHVYITAFKDRKKVITLPKKFTEHDFVGVTGSSTADSKATNTTTKWATMNVDATSATDLGKLYGWGMMTGYSSNTQYDSNFTWTAYKWFDTDKYNAASVKNSPQYYATKYTFADSEYSGIWYEYEEITKDDGTTSKIQVYEGTTVDGVKYKEGTGDGEYTSLRHLFPEDDTATYFWGHHWRMPTHQEFIDLKSRALKNGSNYYVFGTEDNSIQLPYTTGAGYWSNELSSCSYKACCFYWTNALFDYNQNAVRSEGGFIRPVVKEE